MIFKRSLITYIHDLVMAALSLPAAYILRIGIDNIYDDFYGDILALLPVFIIISAVTFQFAGLYRGVWRYASIRDLMNIAIASTAAILVFVLAIFMLTMDVKFPRSIPFIQFMMMMVLLGGPRLLYRAFKDSQFGMHHDGDMAERQKIKVVLLGAGNGAESFLRLHKQYAQGLYQVIGIIDPRGRRAGRTIHGVHVSRMIGGSLANTIAEMERHYHEKPQKVILTEAINAPEYKKMNLDTVTHDAENLGLTLARLPRYGDLKDGLDEAGKLEVRPLQIEDLLGRSQANIDHAMIGRFIKGKGVLVTGAGGSIGSELVRQIIGFDPAYLIAVDNCEYNLYAIDHEIAKRELTQSIFKPVLCDIRDQNALRRVFETYRPDVVFHAAALKHVPMVEFNPSEGILTNVIGTRNVALCARDMNVEAFVQISTDKAVNPANIMGATKRLGEYFCQALDIDNHLQTKGKKGAARTRFMTVRFGNVLGSSGSVVPMFRQQLETGGPLTVTHPEIKRYFMTIREAVGLVLQASAQGIINDDDRGKINVLDMGEPIKIVDIARQMIRLANLQPDVDIDIKFVGLRPGEKLNEELFDKSEVPEKTFNPSVMAASPQPIELKVMERMIASLEKAAARGSRRDIVRLLEEMVPGFADYYDDRLEGSVQKDLAKIQALQAEKA